MRVKSHQIRAKVAFTKPLTTHLMHGKGDFSCGVKGRKVEVPFDLTCYGNLSPATLLGKGWIIRPCESVVATM